MGLGLAQGSVVEDALPLPRSCQARGRDAVQPRAQTDGRVVLAVVVKLVLVNCMGTRRMRVARENGV